MTEPIHVALAGAGAFGIKHLDGIRLIEGVKVVSLIGREPDKTREVAILKAMGMSSASVSSLFRVAGMAIGLLGVSLGLGIGVLTCKLIERLGYLLDAHVYMIERLPTQISPSELLITGSVTVLISLLATLYPSLRAARLHPVDGLRYE